jgi:hypothetical protein
VLDGMFQVCSKNSSTNSVVKRVKTTVLNGMFQMLKDQLEVRHATRLEWIIIWLIVAEVGLEVVWNILIKDSESWQKSSTMQPLFVLFPPWFLFADYP